MVFTLRSLDRPRGSKGVGWEAVATRDPVAVRTRTYESLVLCLSVVTYFFTLVVLLKCHV